MKEKERNDEKIPIIAFCSNFKLKPTLTHIFQLISSYSPQCYSHSI